MRGVFRLYFSIFYAREVRVTKSRDFIHGSLHDFLMHSSCLVVELSVYTFNRLLNLTINIFRNFVCSSRRCNEINKKIYQTTRRINRMQIMYTN